MNQYWIKSEKDFIYINIKKTSQSKFFFVLNKNKKNYDLFKNYKIVFRDLKKNAQNFGIENFSSVLCIVGSFKDGLQGQPFSRIFTLYVRIYQQDLKPKESF